MKKGARVSFWSLLGVLLLAMSLTSFAAIPGKAKKKDNTVITFKDIRWVGIRKAYSMEVVRRNRSYSLEVPYQEVVALQVQMPANASKLRRLVLEGKYDRAIPALKRLVDQYEMLEYDMLLGRYLAQAYLAKGMSRNVISLFDKVARLQPEAYGKPIALHYWNALLNEDKTIKLSKALDKAVKYGTRETAAFALNMRGNMAKKKGDYEDALKDGYLRTWLLYRDVASAQPEALAQGSECFEQLNQVKKAEKLRKELMSKYPTSEYAKDAR